MKTITVLKRALALMDAGRWTKGDFDKQDIKINPKTWRRPKSAPPGKMVTCYCAVGAIHAGAGYYSTARGTDSEAIQSAVEIFAKAVRVDNEDDIYAWNDHKRRTIEQVRGAFQRAIKLAQKAA